MTMLSRGANGDDVKLLQSALRARGFYKEPAAIDSFFGASTEQAVREFQRSSSLKVDGIAGPLTLSKLLDPANKISASPFTPLVSRWAPYLMRCQGGSSDPVPIPVALKWIQIESAGVACATGRVRDGLVMEAGITQVYFEDEYSKVGGFTSAQLRALCSCEGASQHGAPCDDAAMLSHAQVALVDLRTHRSRVRMKLTAAGLHVDETKPDFLAFWKLSHALPGLFSYLRPAMLAVGTMMSWADFRAWVETASDAKLQAIDAGTARYRGAFARVFKNVEDFAAG